VNVLLLQMERAEDVEDLGSLVGAPPEVVEANLVLPLDAGEGPSAMAVPAMTGGGDPLSAPAPTIEGALEVADEPPAEDPMAAAGPSQVAK
jgi:hypothetical protein